MVTLLSFIFQTQASKMTISKHKQTSSFFLIAGMLVIGLLLNACAGSGQKAADEALVKTYSSAKPTVSNEIDKINEQLFAAANLNEDVSDYLLGSGDLLELAVFESEALNTKVRVSSRGFVTLPLLGQVEVKGLSAREAEEHIEKLLVDGHYIRVPHVSIFVEERFSQRVTIVGQVKNPGTYDYKVKHHLLDVLALSGGLSEEAGTTIQIRRIGDTPSGQNVFLVDIDRLLKEGNTELNIEINGGDVVFVPKAGVFFVDGAVRKPGTYPIKQKMILHEAVLVAGGFAPYANKKRVTLIRFNDVGEREVIELDLEANPEKMNLPVQDRDVIFARSSAWGKVVHGTGFNIGIPGVAGFGYRDPAQ